MKTDTAYTAGEVAGSLAFLAIVLCVLAGAGYLIRESIRDREIERQWFRECIADGHKAYECNAMINGTFKRPMRVD